MNLKIYILTCLFIGYSISSINAQNNFKNVDSLIILKGIESHYQKSFEKQDKEESLSLKSEEENNTSIYFDSKGFDKLSVLSDGIKILDTILNKQSTYLVKIFSSKDNFKDKYLCFKLIDSKKQFEFLIDSEYKSIIVIPHINEELIKNFKETKLGEPAEPIIQKNEDYIEIHLLNFNYHKYLEKSFRDMYNKD